MYLLKVIAAFFSSTSDNAIDCYAIGANRGRFYCPAAAARDVRGRRGRAAANGTMTSTIGYSHGVIDVCGTYISPELQQHCEPNAPSVSSFIS